MTQIPAGWYPDPDTSRPGAQQGQRYWDGQQWTEHLAPAPGTRGTPSTPDGQPLAGWWQRVGAYVIDILIVTPLVMVLGWPWIREILRAYRDLVDEAVTAGQTGGSMPDQTELLADLVVPILVLTLVGLLINLVYNVGFLKWKSATPGKLVVGLRVRLRETPGPMSWGTVLMRWAGQNWYAFFSMVPILGGIIGLYPFVDVLWPLWDDKRQALHDKVAKTNVVHHQR